MQAPAGQRELEGMDALLDLPMDEECLNQVYCLSGFVMQAPAGQRELEGMDALLDLPMDDECLNQLLGSSGAGARPADKVHVPPRSRPGLTYSCYIQIIGHHGQLTQQWLARPEIICGSCRHIYAGMLMQCSCSPRKNARNECVRY